MIPFLLEANAAGNATDLTMPERLGIGSNVFLQGMLTVFAVLCIIWFCMVVTRFFIHDLPERRKKAAEAAVSATASDVEASPTTDDGELIAVIAAAVAAYRAEDEGGFRVVAFHRVNK